MIVDSFGKMKFVRHNFTPTKNMLLNKKSDAESHFFRLLSDANIYFVREKGNYKYNTRWCYFDFYLPFWRIYIEIDGKNHESEEQRHIDAEKAHIISKKCRWLVRFTNEEVLAMESITTDAIIDKLAHQLRSKKHKNPEYHKERYYSNLRYNIHQGAEDMLRDAKFEIDKGKKVYLYDNFSGNYFEFKNIMEAKMNVQMSVNEIYDLLENHEYKRCSYRRYVFGWTLEECENNVAKVYY